jgi:hypothetical protein
MSQQKVGHLSKPQVSWTAEIGLGCYSRLVIVPLGCPCSLRKWAKQSAIDPDSGEEVPLFNPRTQDWAEHFRWEGARVVPLSATGRATVDTLAMNRPLLIAIRLEEAAHGRHPPAKS